QPLVRLQMVGVVDHQDPVLGDEADQRYEADLGIDVDRAEAGGEREQRAEDRGRQRDQDDEGIAEALVLSRQHQVDDDQREHEGNDEAVALLNVLPAFALEVVGEAFGEDLGGPLLQEIDDLAHGAAREGYTL